MENHSRLLINEPPRMFFASTATLIGLNESILLQQIHYWLQKSKHHHDGYDWIYNTYEGWQENFPFWSISTIRRGIGNLEKKKLLVTGNYNKLPIDNTKWYRIDYDVLNELERVSRPSVQNEQTTCSDRTDDLFNMNRPLPQITTHSLTTTAEPKSEEQKKPLLMFYEEEMMIRLSPFQMQEINSYVDDFSDGDDVVRHAIGIASDKNKRTYGFVKMLLREWLNNKAESLASVVLYEKEKFAKQNYVPAGKGKINFDDFRE